MEFKKGRKWANFYFIFAILFISIIAQTAEAGESFTWRRYKKETRSFKNPSDLVGTWKCKTVSSHYYCIDSGLYEVHESGLYAYLVQDVVFYENPDGTYSYSTSKAHMFDCVRDNWDLPATADYTIVEDTLILGDPIRPVWPHFTNLRKISAKKFILDVINSLPKAHMVICKRKKINQ
jgi:hypothetical protein